MGCIMPDRKSILSYLLICSVIAMLWPCALSATTARDKFFKAEGCYSRLKKSSERQKYRDNWLLCIRKFQDIYKHDPSGPWAAAGLYMSGKLYQELYKRSFRRSDIKEALYIFGYIIKHFPKSRYKDRAAGAIRTISGSQAEIKRVATKKPLFEKNIKPPAVKITTITGLRFWTGPAYTRVVIDADSETLFTYGLLKKDSSINQPRRLYVDLRSSRLGKDVERIAHVDDNLLRGIRAGQFTPCTTRVVIDIESFKAYNIFSLKNPFRIAIDIWGDPTGITSATGPAARTPKKDATIPPGALTKQFALGVGRVVIDPGHGGRDPGAPGYSTRDTFDRKGVWEADVTLEISKRLARRIREELGLEVILTRDSDRFLTLEERTAFANTKNACLFISIHTNASPDRSAYGITTFSLNLATDEEAILSAARENAVSARNISDLQTILSDLMQNAKIGESHRLAAFTQESLAKYMKKRFSRIRCRGVKQAPFYVLLGAQMPSILIETGFISNLGEYKRLIDSEYQEFLSKAITSGIRNYIKATAPAALLRTVPETRIGG